MYRKTSLDRVKRSEKFIALICFLMVASCVHANSSSPLIGGKFGKALDLSSFSRNAQVEMNELMAERPLTIECWAKFDDFNNYNILMAIGPKSGEHFEIYTSPGNGNLAIYTPKLAQQVHNSSMVLNTDQWYFFAFRVKDKGFELFVDGQCLLVFNSENKVDFEHSSLTIGAIKNEMFGCSGAIDDLRISTREDRLEGFVPAHALTVDDTTIYLFDFEQTDQYQLINAARNALAGKAFFQDTLFMPEGDRFLDEVQDDAYAASTLHGDDRVEIESKLPKQFIKAIIKKEKVKDVAPSVLSLNGPWLMKSSAPAKNANIMNSQVQPFWGEGVEGHWFSPETDRSQWYAVTVPTSVQSALLKRAKQVNGQSETSNFKWLPLSPDSMVSVTNCYTNISTTEDYWEGEVKDSADPYVEFSPVDINANQYKYLYVKMSMDSGCLLQFFYAAKDEPITEAKSAKVGPLITSGTPKLYVINLSSIPGWKGQIQRLRLDVDGVRTSSKVKIYGIGIAEKSMKSYDNMTVFPAPAPDYIDNPFWDDNNYNELINYGIPEGVPWQMRFTRIEQNDWWFARKFNLPTEFAGKKLRLYFDGIDYSGSFYLNGKPLGCHSGMFGGPEYDITNLVNADHENELVVRINSVPKSWFGVLKGSPGWGWHYGHLISLGIWRDVEICTVPQVEITSPFVKTLSIDNAKAVLSIEYYVQNDESQTQEFEIIGMLNGKNCDTEALVFQNKIVAPNGQTRFETHVEIENPKLWWPLNYGSQNLYNLKLTARSVEKHPKPIQTAQTTFGIRTLKVLPLYGTKAEEDYRWQFVVNNVPLFIKGANWCWSDPMLDCDPAKYEQILELARRCGIQMFRAWGGGIIETDTFYRLCDEKGLMVYQEFPYCWLPPDFPQTDPAVLDQQVSRVVMRLRNHPSLVMWGGGNENVHVPGADEGLFLVGRRCRQYDPTRPFHRTDPWGGSIHNWSVFHGGEPIDLNFAGWPSPWLGEFGLPSMPNYDSCLKFLPAEKLNIWPPNPDDAGVIAHMNQFSYGDIFKVMRYADYGPINSWKQYIDYSQMAQGDEIAFATNLQRAGSYFTKGGLWFYKLTELFPGHSWGILDFYGCPKLSYYRAKRHYAPQAAYVYYGKFNWKPGEKFKATLHVNNDSNKSLKNAMAKVVIYDSKLNPIYSNTWPIESVAISSRLDVDQIKISLPQENITPFLLAVSLEDNHGQKLSDQWNWFNFQDKSEEIMEYEVKLRGIGVEHNAAIEAIEAYGKPCHSPLLSLPSTQLDVTLECEENTGSITIKNMSDRPAFNVIIEHFPYGHGDFLADNGFSLYPNEKRTIPFELVSDFHSLGNLVVRAWNAEPVEVK